MCAGGGPGAVYVYDDVDARGGREGGREGGNERTNEESHMNVRRFFARAFLTICLNVRRELVSNAGATPTEDRRKKERTNERTGIVRGWRGHAFTAEYRSRS